MSFHQSLALSSCDSAIFRMARGTIACALACAIGLVGCAQPPIQKKTWWGVPIMAESPPRCGRSEPTDDLYPELANARAAAQKTPRPPMKLDGGSTLSAIGRTRQETYRLSADDSKTLEDAYALAKSSRRDLLFLPYAIAIVMLKDIDSLMPIIHAACASMSDRISRAAMDTIADRAAGFLVRYYRDPISAEIIDRIQASRRQLIALARDAVSGRPSALAEWARMSRFDVGDPSLSSEAARLSVDLNGVWKELHRQGQEGNFGARFAASILAPASFSTNLAQESLQAARKNSPESAVLALFVPMLQIGGVISGAESAADRRALEKEFRRCYTNAASESERARCAKYLER